MFIVGSAQEESHFYFFVSHLFESDQSVNQSIDRLATDRLTLQDKWRRYAPASAEGRSGAVSGGSRRQQSASSLNSARSSQF